jgi:hypothetical protein
MLEFSNMIGKDTGDFSELYKKKEPPRLARRL